MTDADAGSQADHSGEEPDPNDLLDVAYAVETPDDCKQLYARWADTYDSDFIESSGYIYHDNVAHTFLDAGGGAGGAVLDVGCGTGIVGVSLGDMGEMVVDGLDISEEMLEIARTKKTIHGAPAYRDLIQADLTGTVAIEDDTYMGILSAGTFTHGHLGPESLDELVRVASPTAVCAIGINEDHYIEHGFDAWFAKASNEGRITSPDIVSVAIYDDLVGEHAGARGAVAVFQVTAG